jgi:hypothetical protein
MENPTAPVPGDEPSDDAEGVGPLPDFEEADDGIVDVHMEADNPHQEVGTLVAKGKDFGPTRANATALAKLILSYGAAVYEIAKKSVRPGDWVGEPDIDIFEFDSAHVRFIAGSNESVRMDDPESSPAREAANKIADLMQAHDDELLELARGVGPDGAAAYRRLLKVIGDSEDAKVSWASHGRAPVVVTTVGAARAFRTLSREGESESEDFTVIGHLSMADDHSNRFELRLFKGAPRPRQVKGKQVIRGTFEDRVGDLVKEKGLWSSDVEAEIHIERERAETVAAPRDPKFVLVSVRGSTTPRPGKGRPSIPGSVPLDDDIFGDSK